MGALKFPCFCIISQEIAQLVNCKYIQQTVTNITEKEKEKRKSPLLLQRKMRSFTILFSIFLFLHLSSFTISDFSNCSNDKYYTEGGIYGDNLNKLLDSLSSDSEKGAGFYNLSAGRYPNQVYGIALCRGDVLPLNCTDCIKSSAGEILQICPNQTEAVMYSDDCLLRFSDSDIFGKKSSDTKQTVTIVVVSIIGGVILIICVWLFLRIRKPKRRLEVTSFKEKDNIDDANSLQFNFETIRAATSYFSDQKKIGQGGFGTVYKGTLADGQDIAVKRLSRHSEQGDSEFKNEVMLVAQLQHRNLVRLLGRGTERLLIYELVPNTSLDHFIFDLMKRSQLDWDRRYRIIKGIVKGLLYLHEDSRLRIVHRDMKASNILLDEEMNPKIADFGMARLFIVDQTQGNTSKIVGTYGYMAPEYAMHGQFSVKSDVYSFGVLVLEIVSGQRNNCFQSKENKMDDLLTYAWKNWKEGTYMNIVDPNLENGLRSEIMRCIHIGLLCVQENVTDRPTMASVLLMLNSNSLSLPIPLQPLFFMHSTIESDHVSLASSM